MLYTACRCPKHPEYNPNHEEKRNCFNENCPTCSGIFYGTKLVGDFPGESRVNNEVMLSAQYRIGPLSLEQFGHVRFSLGFRRYYDDEASKFFVDVIDRMVYVEKTIDTRLLQNFLKEGCTIYERTWPDPPRMTLFHFLYAIGEGFQEFWSTLTNPPKKPFVETVVTSE